MGEMSKYVMTLDSVQPRKSSEAIGHRGGQGWFLINKDTVGSECLRLHVSEYVPGGYTKGHPIHMDQEQAYYVLSGTMTLDLDDKTYTVPAGSFAYVPRGVEHNYRNEQQEKLRFIIVTVPVGSGDPPPMPA